MSEVLLIVRREFLERVRGELNARVQAEELDGYVVIPPDVLEGNRVLYRARSIANAGVLRDIRRAASQAVQAERLRAAGLDGGELAALIRPVQVDEARITGEGEEGGDGMPPFSSPTSCSSWSTSWWSSTATG
jgi:ABC-type Na+ efflux pump permease subunit